MKSMAVALTYSKCKSWWMQQDTPHMNPSWTHPGAAVLHHTTSSSSTNSTAGRGNAIQESPGSQPRQQLQLAVVHTTCPAVGAGGGTAVQAPPQGQALWGLPLQQSLQHRGLGLLPVHLGAGHLRGSAPRHPHSSSGGCSSGSNHGSSSRTGARRRRDGWSSITAGVGGYQGGGCMGVDSGLKAITAVMVTASRDCSV